MLKLAILLIATILISCTPKNEKVQSTQKKRIVDKNIFDISSIGTGQKYQIEWTSGFPKSNKIFLKLLDSNVNYLDSLAFDNLLFEAKPFPAGDQFLQLKLALQAGNGHFLEKAIFLVVKDEKLICSLNIYAEDLIEIGGAKEVYSVKLAKKDLEINVKEQFESSIDKMNFEKTTSLKFNKQNALFYNILIELPNGTIAPAIELQKYSYVHENGNWKAFDEN